MQILGALAVAGSVMWFLYTSLAPVDVPPPPPIRGALSFDVRADLSKDQRFMQLRGLVKDFEIVPGAAGRPNPFMPLPPPLPEFATTTASSTAAATSTQSVAPTSTQPIVPDTELPTSTESGVEEN